MRSLALAVLLTLGPQLPVLADGEVYQPPRPPGTVAVYRGGSANLLSPTLVYRGSAAAPSYLTAAAPEPGVAVVGGRRIWFVDPARDELIGCRTVSTFTVGRDAIRCVRRRLPTD
ncbi:MAG TPA: hypothetical protein VFY87_10915 [Geminicoccaceae bacterium]|nr:hypothetical protein [Geminicoccaceae bacterium]